MRIMVTGASGMLGRQLTRLAGEKHSVSAFSRSELDVTDHERIRREVDRIAPDWIIHAAAFTRVDAAETESAEAVLVNETASANLAQAAQNCGSALLYFSTDYVFDGCTDRPYREEDPTGPLNVYGRSKLAGEEAIRATCPRHLIVRTSWLYGPGGVNFVEKILARAKEGTPLRVVDDQVGSPTVTMDLAAMSLRLLESHARGTVHVTNSGSCSWYRFAREILDLMELQTPLSPVSSLEFVTPAKRPAYSVLSGAKLQEEGFPPMPPWQNALTRYLELSYDRKASGQEQKSLP